MATITPSAIKFTRTAAGTQIGSAAPPAYSSSFTDTTKITDIAYKDYTTFETSNSLASIVFYFVIAAGSFSASDLLNLSLSTVSTSSGTAYVWESSDGTNWGTNVNSISVGSSSNNTVNANGTSSSNGTITPNQAQYLALVVTTTSSAAFSVSDVRITGSSSGNYIGASAGSVDVTPPALSSAVVQNSGTTLFLNWTESGSPPVLQATGLGATQGLTFSGFSGGAVSATAVSTSGVTSTVTLSRTVLSGETGGLLSIAMSAFTDSASPGNPTNALSGFAVTNSSTYNPVPGAPSINSVTPGNAQVAILWTTGTGVSTSYNVKRSLTVGGTYTNLSAGTGVVGTSFTDSTAVNGTQYFYEVSGVNGTGEGAVSVPSAGVTPTASTAGPTGLTAVYTIAQGITLNWTNPTGNNYIGINVYRLWGTGLANINNVPQRIDQTPFQYIAPATVTYVDRLVGTGLAFLSGSNINSYFVVGVLPNGTESTPSNVAGPVSFTG